MRLAVSPLLYSKPGRRCSPEAPARSGAVRTQTGDLAPFPGSERGHRGASFLTAPHRGPRRLPSPRPPRPGPPAPRPRGAARTSPRPGLCGLRFWPPRPAAFLTFVLPLRRPAPTRSPIPAVALTTAPGLGLSSAARGTCCGSRFSLFHAGPLPTVIGHTRTAFVKYLVCLDVNFVPQIGPSDRICSLGLLLGASPPPSALGSQTAVPVPTSPSVLCCHCSQGPLRF